MASSSARTMPTSPASIFWILLTQQPSRSAICGCVTFARSRRRLSCLPSCQRGSSDRSAWASVPPPSTGTGSSFDLTRRCKQGRATRQPNVPGPALRRKVMPGNIDILMRRCERGVVAHRSQTKTPRQGGVGLATARAARRRGAPRPAIDPGSAMTIRAGRAAEHPPGRQRGLVPVEVPVELAGPAMPRPDAVAGPAAPTDWRRRLPPPGSARSATSARPGGRMRSS